MTRWLWAAAVGCGLAGPAVGQPPKGDDPLSRTLADWKARQGKVKTARYVVTGTVEYIAPLDSEDVIPPAGQRVRPHRATLLLDFERGRFRIEAESEVMKQGGGFSPASSTTAYNGKETRYGRPREQARTRGGFDLVINKGAKDATTGPGVQNLHLPVFYAHGVVSTVHQVFYLHRLPLDLNREDFVPVGRQGLRGRVHEVFRTEPLPTGSPIADEFWVDPARQGAIVRQVDLVGGKPWQRLDIEWRQTALGWWPERWTQTLTTTDQTVKRIEKARIETYEYDPPVTDADFTIPAEPGMEWVEVVEAVAPGSGLDPGSPPYRKYRIDAGGRWIEVEAKGGVRLDGTEVLVGSWWGWWPWAAGAVLIVSLGTVLVWRRRPTERPMPPTNLPEEG